MTDNEKIPYIQCLKHTGKKVYKYWFAALAVIGVVIGLGLVISSAWQQIIDGFKYVERYVEYIWNSLDFIATTIGGAINQILSVAFTIPWYWWVGIGVIIGPLILVAIYCALKHFDVVAAIIIICFVTFGSLCGLINCASCIVRSNIDIFSYITGIFSALWLCLIFMACSSGDPSC
jgi:hypothetical protein